MQDLRCISKKRHGILDAEGHTLEVKCNSRICGAQRGVVVLHRFNLLTGELIETHKYKEPRKE